MKHLFDFDLSTTVLNIKLAFSYQPKILNLDITDRPYSGLLYVQSGTYRYQYEDGSFVAEAGSVIYLPPGSKPYCYTIQSDSNQALAKAMQIEFELLSAGNNNTIAFSEHPIQAFTDINGMVRKAFEAVIGNYAKTDPISRLSLYANMYRLLALCMEGSEKQYTQSVYGKIFPAIQFIQENYTKPFRIEEAATLCHISESQLRRLFREVLGKTPTAYKNELLMDTACKLLETGELRISEIAEILGFSDIYSFSHWFYRTTGTSPKGFGMPKS